MSTLDAIYNKWKSHVVTGEVQVGKPGLIAFNNAVRALELLNHHISSGSRIAIHCDVDMDGIGSGYIFKRFLSQLTGARVTCAINKDRVHGIQPKYVEYFTNNPVDLLVILDSSSNEIKTIENMPCDVLIIDHHEVEYKSSCYSGNTAKGRWLLVNNTLDGQNIDEVNIRFPSICLQELFKAESRMSCGEVVYEFLRLYEKAFGTGDLLDNMMLYQWAGVTLFTDSISLLTERNQWYIEKTVYSSSLEPTLRALLGNLNPFKFRLDKSFINYTLAPTINRTIRAGASGQALDIVMNRPKDIQELQVYREVQDRAISVGASDIVESETYILRDLSSTGISQNYCGVIAGKLSDTYKKNVAVYTIDGEGNACGSFRGREAQTKYKDAFHSSGVWAQGHQAAFGFRGTVDKLKGAIENLPSIEQGAETCEYLTAGDISEPSTYHIDDFDDFKKSGGLLRMGIGNSRVAGNEQIMIAVNSKEATLMESKGKLWKYNIFGLPCKAFSEIEGPTVHIYPEYSNNLEFYIK